MKELHKLEDYDLEVLESFINNSIEESPYIEFKSGDALSKKDSHKKEISKDVSAFANSDGGIIIYGITEKNHKADSLSFINGNEFNKEWLEQIITSTIHRNIPGLKIFPIRRNNNVEETLYVVQIPSSIEAPHMCREKRFYKRGLFESIIMEEYEVRQLYGRRVKSKLKLRGYTITPISPWNDKICSFRIETGIINDGEKVENDYNVNTYLSKSKINLKIYWETHIKNLYYTRLGDNRAKVSASSVAPIYPNEMLNVARFCVELSVDDILNKLNEISIEFKLYYSNGEDNLETDFKSFIGKFDDLKNELKES